MTSNAGTVFLLATILASAIKPTEYSRATQSPKEKTKTTRTAACGKIENECGKFKAPTSDAGKYICHMKSNCDMLCKMTCHKKAVNEILYINKNGEKETYRCSNKTWQLKGHYRHECIAKIQVKEIVQNFPHTEEVNDLLGDLFNTSYYYLAMASFYQRADVALPGFSQLMIDLWMSEVKLSRDLISYINRRGGYLDLPDIPSPKPQSKIISMDKPGLDGLEIALGVTRSVNEHALTLHQIIKLRIPADPHLKFYLEESIISQKTETLQKLADRIQQLKSFSSEDYVIGEYLMDLEIAGHQAELNL